MKISNLKIVDPQGQLIQNIDFNLEGISYVLGDITAPKDNSKTTNSIGKTLLLKLVDYIFGAKENKDIVKDAIKDYVLVAIVQHNGECFLVNRTLGNSNSITVDGIQKSLEEYKTFFNLNRALLSRQIVLQNKQSIISVMPKPMESDFRDIFTLLKLESICESIVRIYKLQDEYKTIEQNKIQVLGLLGISTDKVGDEIFFTEKDIDSLTQRIAEINNQVVALRLNAENTNLQDEYTKLNGQVKMLRGELFELDAEKESLEKYIADSHLSNLDSRTIKDIYEKAKISLPTTVIRSIEEVDVFYKSIYENRISQSKIRIEQINMLIESKANQIKAIEQRLDSLSDILSTNDAYKNALEILYDCNANLQSLKYRQGQLSQVATFIKEQNTKDNELLAEFAHLGALKDEFDETHKKYKDFVYHIVNKIYDKSARASFDIIFREYDKKKRPVSISMEITGDAGEGVKEVKKTIMDYLLFRFNDLLELFVHDSSCYNGVDPRQVGGLLQELCKMANENKKQVIISINKYQLSDEKFIEEVINNACIKLSETEKLFAFDF